MIWADGEIHQNERDTMIKYCRIFGFLEENLENLVDFLLKCAEENLSVDEILLKINK